MGKELLIGVDIGTQGVKTVLFRADGAAVHSAFRKSELHSPAAGVVEEDPEKQLRNVIEGIRECVDSGRIDVREIAAIGIDGQMAGVIGVGSDGRNVTPYDSWLDRRCGRYIEEMERAVGKEVLQKTGNIPSFNHGPKKLWWMRERPEAFSKIAAFVQPGAYAAMRLCGLAGRKAFIDKTYLHFSGFADNRRDCWDAGLCERMAMPMEKLPRIVDSHEVVGNLISSFAEECGLRGGIPVIAGCGDTAASFLSTGATSAGACVDVAGTASVFCLTVDDFRADTKHRTLGCGQAAIAGLWHVYAYVNGGGMNLEWFRDVMAKGTAEDGEISFEELNELAGQVVLADENPLFVPHLGGRVCPSEPNMSGAWVGLSWNHGTGHLYRSMLESVALEYAFFKAVACELYPELRPKEVRITGGGEKSAVWNEMKSGALDLPAVQLSDCQGAPGGVAILAGYGVGLFKDVGKTAEDWIDRGRTFKASEEHICYYRKRLQKYLKLLEQMRSLAKGELNSDQL